VLVLRGLVELVAVLRTGAEVVTFASMLAGCTRRQQIQVNECVEARCFVWGIIGDMAVLGC